MSRICVCCDADATMIPFSGETHQVDYRGHVDLVSGLAGYRCPTCGEVEFDDDGAARYAAAGDALISAIRTKHGAELRRVRTKLRLTQAEAERLTGGGHNAFSRYETGKVDPAPAVMNLFRLLDRHPEEIEVLRRAEANNEATA